jgi:dTDP-4-dehydrorhamnose reductase
MKGRPVWISGAGGLIGNWLVQTAPRNRFEGPVAALTRDQLELTDFAAVRKAFRSQKPAAVIHCAALSRSPECQRNPALARKVNVETTALLGELSAGIPFVFFSTDLVFDGKVGNYDESAEVNPLSVYAETKVAAERIVLANPRHTVVRTSLNCGASPAGDRGFDEQIIGAWKAGQTLQLFTDEFRCPIPAETTARAVWEILTQNQAGIFHLAGKDRLSRWEIGELLARHYTNLTPRIEPASLKDYSGATRPPDTSLDCSKVQPLLSFPLPGLESWLGTQPHTAP